MSGRSVLMGALTNVGPGARSAIANRLLEDGAVAEDSGTPLQLLMSPFAYTDETLAPFYDVLFARGDLDLLTTGAFGKSAYVMAAEIRHRQGLRARVERYLAVHRIGFPPRSERSPQRSPDPHGLGVVDEDRRSAPPPLGPDA
ncbi:hypothetical protein ABZ621_30470 [Streptomyces sp. NPDC007863]|uniref:hypothetical protein n=1 Tax=Streptomyces sp. NPDC007863 TaxID=3154894 RepID=UPI0033FA4A10